VTIGSYAPLQPGEDGLAYLRRIGNRRHPMSPAALRDLLKADPRSGMVRGRLRAVRERFDLTPDQRAVVEHMATVAPRAIEKPKAVDGHNLRRFPTRPSTSFPGQPTKGGPSGLSAADLLLIQRMPTDPHQLDAEAIETLRNLERNAASPSEQRLVSGPLEVLRREQDLAQRRARLAQEVQTAGDAACWLTAGATAIRYNQRDTPTIRALAEAILEENPALDEAQAKAAAIVEIQASAAQFLDEHARRYTAAQDALARLEATA